ncbi:uncharacterized protein B0I36DRAFT_295415 [Microdochium trichocladiopsis]|uniref:Uncharacterized protein n=1 Tax=Microdochium trichocladiopsis TaxID=1682393 RepID=A0A9P9BLB3_9PEZI|nr:uncharacterized protein B0I36DRAFT_295415 [Microdochium trichocladiopsis]KAH7024747.1 hypothetical protein B0I36DRAFT_295415 [Microdochium trichocladiopsis]
MADTRIPILTVSLARHLAGHDIQHVLDKAWLDPAVPATTRDRFENQGFNLDIVDPEKNLASLRQTLKDREWAGIILGWCVRGHAEFTEFFESVTAVCVDHITETSAPAAANRTKLIFCSGPDDLVNASLRNFPMPPSTNH